MLVENFRPGVLDRLGFPVERLHELNPALIVLSITGFGHDGPEGGRPGYDAIVQGEAGIMSVTGPPGTPSKVGLSIADILAAHNGVAGVLAALYERSRTGRGTVVRTSLLASVVGAHMFQGTRWTVARDVPESVGNDHPSIAPYGTFRCKDGQIQIGVANQNLWRRFAPLVGLDPDDPRYATIPDRAARRPALTADIERVLAEDTRDNWLARLDEAGIPRRVDPVDRRGLRVGADALAGPRHRGRPSAARPDRAPGTPAPLRRRAAPRAHRAPAARRAQRRDKGLAGREGEGRVMDLLGESGGPVRIAYRELPRDELLGWASAVAAEIAGAEAVAVHATASLETVAAVVGGVLAGVPVVPLPPDSGPAERAHILGDSGANLLFAVGGTKTAEGEPPLILIDALPHNGSGGTNPADDATALILYTSGTTGAPKGVLISRSAIAAGLDALAEAWAWTPDDVLVHGLPLFHVHGLVLGVLGALRTGSPLVHTGRPKPELYAQAAQNDGGSLFFGVPTVWSRTAADPNTAQALRSARLLVSGSAPLPVPVFEPLRTHRTSPRRALRHDRDPHHAQRPRRRRQTPRLRVGTPLPGVETRLRAEDGTPVPHDGETPGELHVRAPLLFKGYLNRPEATAESFARDGWFRTGDIATIGPDGWHRIVGRASTDLIKSGGYRIGAARSRTRCSPTRP